MHHIRENNTLIEDSDMRKTNFDLTETEEIVNQSIFANLPKDSKEENNSANKFDSRSIFGELIDEQAQRIRKFSPYGKFKTWKICRIIGK